MMVITKLQIIIIIYNALGSRKKRHRIIEEAEDAKIPKNF